MNQQIIYGSEYGTTRRYCLFIIPMLRMMN